LVKEAVAQEEEKVRKNKRPSKGRVETIAVSGRTVLCQCLTHWLLEVPLAGQQLGADGGIIRGLVPGRLTRATAGTLKHALGAAADDGGHGHDEGGEAWMLIAGKSSTGDDIVDAVARGRESSTPDSFFAG
jgi:hypothetical protein